MNSWDGVSRTCRDSSRPQHVHKKWGDVAQGCLVAFLWQAVYGEGRVQWAWGHTCCTCCRGAVGRADLWGCGGRVGCGWVDPARPRSPHCVSSYMAPPLWASPLTCALLTGKAVSRLMTASGQDACPLVQVWGSHLVMMQGSGTPLTPPACPSESLTPPVSSRHRGSLWLHTPSRSCVILPFLCEGELWPVGRIVVLSLCACTW